MDQFWAPVKDKILWRQFLPFVATLTSSLTYEVFALKEIAYPLVRTKLGGMYFAAGKLTFTAWTLGWLGY